MSAAPRSLADDLRRRTPEQLELLLTRRSDLLHPIPTSFADLARRANDMTSASMAVAQLTGSELDTLHAAGALAPDHKVTGQTLRDGLATTDPAVADALGTLWGLALLWGPDSDLRIPLAVRELMGPHPCGLDLVVRRRDPRSVTFPLDQPESPEGFAGAPDGTAELLEELIWQNPQLATASGVPDPAVAWLNRQGLLVPLGDSGWVLPRDLSLRLRRGRLLQRPFATPPELTGRRWPAGQVTATAGHASDQFLRTVDRVCYSIRLNPPALRRQGGLAGRKWQGLAEELRVTPADLALVLELLSRCGWIADNGIGGLSPTSGYESGADLPRAERWCMLAESWLTMPRRPWDGRPGQAGEAAQPPLSPGLGDDQAPARRRDLLAALRSAGAAPTMPELLPWLRWRRPRTPPDPGEVGCLLGQAELIGITGLGALSPAGKLLSLDSPTSEVIASVRTVLPDTRDRLLMQADLTATAVDPLPAATERRLNRVAEYESGGAATVFRFTSESVARGLAHGESPDQLLEWLAKLSDTEIPRTLAVLVSDVARQRSRVRMVTTTALLTGDPDSLEQILSSDVAAELGLIRICDHTIAIAPPDALRAAASTSGDDDRQVQVIGRLRAAGFHVEEPPAVAPPAPAADRDVAILDRGVPAALLAARAVRALRMIEGVAGPEFLAAPASAADPGSGPSLDLPQRLESAAAAMRKVNLEFSDETGSIRQHLVIPLEVANGAVTILDHGAVRETDRAGVQPGPEQGTAQQASTQQASTQPAMTVSAEPAIRVIPLSRVLGLSTSPAG